MVKNQIKITFYYILPQVFVVCSGCNKHVLRSILWVWLLEPLRLDSPLGPSHHLLVLWEGPQPVLPPVWDSAPGFLISWSGESAETPLLNYLHKFTFTSGGSCLFLVHSDNVGISHSARGPIISGQICGAMVPFLHETLRLNPIITVFPLNLKHHHMIIAFRQSVTWTIGIEAKNLISFKKWKKKWGRGSYLWFIEYAFLIPLHRYLNYLVDFFWIF